MNRTRPIHCQSPDLTGNSCGQCTLTQCLHAVQHNADPCPRCDGDLYDNSAGHCDECGFEGFDGDQT